MLTKAATMTEPYERVEAMRLTKSRLNNSQPLQTTELYHTNYQGTGYGPRGPKGKTKGMQWGHERKLSPPPTYGLRPDGAQQMTECRQKQCRKRHERPKVQTGRLVKDKSGKMQRLNMTIAPDRQNTHCCLGQHSNARPEHGLNMTSILGFRQTNRQIRQTGKKKKKIW